MISIEDIMTSRLHTLKASSTVEHASDLMKEHAIRHIPVVNDFGRLLGLVTQRDILAATSPLGKRQPEEISASLTYVMNRQLITISRDTRLTSAASLLQKHRIGCLPVVEKEKLIGLVTDSDFVTIAIHLLEQLEMVEPVEDVY